MKKAETIKLQQKCSIMTLLPLKALHPVLAVPQGPVLWRAAGGGRREGCRGDQHGKQRPEPSSEAGQGLTQV